MLKIKFAKEVRMKKKNYLIVPLILLLTSCSPKFITQTTKISPSPKCFKSCNKKYEIDKKVFIQKCQDKVKICAVETERKVTADFSKYKIKYQKDLLNYKRELVSYQNSMILYKEKFDAYLDRKSKAREEYEDDMDEYYDEKRKYRDKLSVYENWKREKDENEANKRACSSSSKNKYSCQKVREYEDKYRFTFSSDIPKRPKYEPHRPHKRNVISKPEKPLKPLMPTEPVLLTIIGKEKEKCASSCAYPLKNSCFSSCGGSVKYEQVCIENCKETVK